VRDELVYNLLIWHGA